MNGAPAGPNRFRIDKKKKTLYIQALLKILEKSPADGLKGCKELCFSTLYMLHRNIPDLEGLEKSLDKLNDVIDI